MGWLVAWRHQSITWTSVDSSPNVFFAIYLRVIPQEGWIIPQHMFGDYTLQSPPHLPRFNEIFSTSTTVHLIRTHIMKFMSVYSSPPGQNDRHFADDIYQRIFLNENVRLSIQLSLKFLPKGPINNKSALVQVMACHLFGAKPLPEPMLSQFTDAYMRHWGEMS